MNVTFGDLFVISESALEFIIIMAKIHIFLTFTCLLFIRYTDVFLIKKCADDFLNRFPFPIYVVGVYVLWYLSPFQTSFPITDLLSFPALACGTIIIGIEVIMMWTFHIVTRKN